MLPSSLEVYPKDRTHPDLYTGVKNRIIKLGHNIANIVHNAFPSESFLRVARARTQVQVLVLILGLKYLYLTFSRHLKLSFSQTERFRTVVSKYSHKIAAVLLFQEYFSVNRAKLFCFWECITIIGQFLSRGRIIVQQLDKSFIFMRIASLIT